MVQYYDPPPFAAIYPFVNDRLIGGDKKLVTTTVTIAAGQVLVRGSVLGQITAGGATQGQYNLSVAAATDGSQTPICILVDSIDTTAGANTAGVYLEGEFNSAALTLGAGQTIASIRQFLRPIGIHLKTPVLGDPV